MTPGQIGLLLTLYLAAAYGQCFRENDYAPSKHQLFMGMEDFFDASTQFSIRLLHALNTTENTFISPFSVWSSLILIYLGSKGATEKELEGVLSLQGFEKNVVAYSYQSLKLWFTSKIRTPSSALSSFTMVNHLFLQKDIKMRSCLLPFMEDDLAYVDFYQNPELARRAINYFIQRQTKNKIKEILPPSSIKHYTDFVVTSTMHFKGVWLQPFLPQSTQRGPFFTTNLDYKFVDMMVTRDTFLYADSEELQCSAIEMPYAGRSLTMVLMLPKNKAHGVQILSSSLTMSRLGNLTEDMFPREMVVVVPKFQFEDSFQLSSTLIKMGLRSLSSGALELSGFSKDRVLRVNSIYHKAKVSVDEQGTEAAAATATAFARSSRPTRIIEFIVDRPFVFYIRENHSGSILFVGIVRNPKYLQSRDH
ncbi:leukocyte elastase inhibitor-like isoform X1 [Parasteatoda tepidariorum]|uniref:leukocyte elastase inhibitor-like isoform X1 n=2 Tax=Parasteatoda tepidariorum TaxID=114398 RepID=UPI001C71ABA8|nr:leukocyte elastase inhibitor-like [Parasteatoda tepidariorum]